MVCRPPGSANCPACRDVLHPNSVRYAFTVMSSMSLGRAFRCFSLALRLRLAMARFHWVARTLRMVCPAMARLRNLALCVSPEPAGGRSAVATEFPLIDADPHGGEPGIGIVRPEKAHPAFEIVPFQLQRAWDVADQERGGGQVVRRPFSFRGGRRRASPGTAPTRRCPRRMPPRTGQYQRRSPPSTPGGDEGAPVFQADRFPLCQQATASSRASASALRPSAR